MFRKMSFLLSFIAIGVLSIQAATISGVVHENNAAGDVIGGAKVTLTPTAAGDTAVTVTSNATTGAYSFSNVAGTVAAPLNYRIVAAKTGYRVAANTTLRVTGVDLTQDLYLVSSATTGLHSVYGTISDSAAGSSTTELVGAQVILTSRGVGFPARPATSDTVISVDGGAYSFDSVAVGNYTLTISDLGFATQTMNVTVANADIVQNFKLLEIETSSIAGTVTDSGTTTGIANAKVYLLTRGGIGAGVIIDSTLTKADGSYTLPTVPSSAAGINYTVRATMTDYVTGSVNTSVTGTTPKTGVNIKLVAIEMASITGTVTDSSSSGVTKLAGVQITLRSGTMVVDSTVTNASGVYTIADVPSGVSYSIRAVAMGHVTSNTLVNIIGTSEQTVNIRMVKNPSGNLNILVLAKTDSSAISGASVSAATGTTMLNGTTSSKGLVSFLDIVPGNYSISVSAAGKTPISSTTTLMTNGNDTVKIYMVAAAGGTKALSGTIKDSASMTVLAHVRVELVIQNAGIGGAALTIVDSTDGSGNYSFVGLPISRNTGRITATLSGYKTYTNAAVTIGAANTADNTIFNFVMQTVPVGVKSLVSHASGIPDFSMASKGILRLSNMGDAGMAKVFGMNGKLLFQSAINARTTSLALPANMIKSGSAYIVSVTQNSAVYRKQIMMP